MSDSLDMDESLSKAEAAEFLACSVRTIERAMKAGLPYFKGIGRGPQFTRRDLIVFRDKFRREAA